MSTVELRKRLIEKIQTTEDSNLLEEIFRLFDLASKDMEPYKLSDEQLSAVNESRQQIKEGKYLGNDQADKETDEWLSK